LRPETIRVIDIWAGRAICFLLTVVRRFLDGLAGRLDPAAPPRRILFVKLIEQGATVLAAGAVERAAAMVGRENVFFCVFEENREILDILDLVPPGNIIPVRHANFAVFVLDVLRLVARVRREGVDAVIDMEFFARASAILSFLTGAGKRVGLHRYTAEAPYRGDLFTHRVQYNPYLHTAAAYEALVAALAAGAEDEPLLKEDARPLGKKVPAFRPSAGETLKVKALLEEAFGGEATGGPLVLLNPNASDMLPLRKWPAERFVALGKMILRDFPQARIAVTGAPSEADAAEEIRRLIGTRRTACLAGRTSLRDLIVLYTLSDVLVTNDSGPGHFASLTDIHSVVLYGPETPRLFGAVGGNSHVLYAGLACSPCVNVFNHRFSPCRRNRCMEAITVEEVYGVVARCLRERQGAGHE